MKKDAENIRKQVLLDYLKDLPSQTLQITYLYAKNYVDYGEDVTKIWDNVAQNTSALQKAYHKGYYDALQSHAGQIYTWRKE